MSCGLRLLSAPRECFDYCLYITDSKKIVKVYCHRSVLLAHSIRMRELITPENYFDLTITVLIGYVGSMLELIQFMYLKNTGLFTNREKILELCAVLKMKPEFVIASNVVQNLEHNSIDLDSCKLSTEFVTLVSMKKYVEPNQPISSSQFDIKVSSNGMDTTVNVQINNNMKTNNDQMSENVVSDDNMVLQFDDANMKPIDKLLLNCDAPLNHSKQTNTFLFIPPRILRSNMKRLRSTRNY
jgi:hypothetical protein